jgi:cobalamin biosynthesis Mg chelatase CobN
LANPRLHLDADTSIKALLEALQERGYDVTRTPTPWAPRDASDEAQLLGATAQGRIIFTFNIRDFLALAKKYPRHGGVLLAFQRSWTLPELLSALDRLLSETKADEWIGQVRWLNDWRGKTAARG